MRVILDTNVLISAVLSPESSSALLLEYWHDGKFELLTCDEHIDELRRITRSAKIAPFILASWAGRLVNDLRNAAIRIEKLPEVDLSPDPYDNFLLALADAGSADFLVTGDKRDLLTFKGYGRTQITTVRAFLDRF